MKPFFVYMLRCADGSYYVGHTDDLQGRVSKHQAGVIDEFTRERRPVELVWSQEAATRHEAVVAEQRIKGLAPERMEALIAQGRQRAEAPAPDRKINLRRHHPPVVETPSEAPRRRVDVRRPHPPVATVEEKEVPAEPPAIDDSPLIQGVLQGQRRAIAKSITLLESTRPDHRQRADALLNALLPHTGHAKRIGISGVPGVGKSTFIEALGLHLIEQGHKVAVLAVDPSSSVSGGSILGDKTRMEKLSVHDRAYIRPSAASGTLGGVAEKTREAMLVCEAAGHDVVIVETVGVGQSETAVAGMTDLFVLLQLPNAGDDLQAIKKGVMELADLVVINKADIDPDAAMRAQATITSALRLFSFHGHAGAHAAKVMQVSALKGDGIAAFWQLVDGTLAKRRESGAFEQRRKQQALAWMWDLIHARLQADFKHHPRVRAALADTVRDVGEARVAPSSAARSLLDLFEKH